MSLTQLLGTFVAGLAFDDVGEDASAVVRRGFIDCTGVMIAGRYQPATRVLREVLGRDGARESSLYFTGELAGALSAALINATAAHALDYDDVGMDGHPSCVLVPAILAEGEAIDAPGQDLITAYLAAYETWAELAHRETGLIYERGWHPTSTIGAIAAAAACASLLDLNAEQAAHALAIAASQSAGLIANSGTMTKPLHAGRAAQTGVFAARLAKAGYSAARDALEHDYGFLAAVSQHGDVDRTSPLRVDPANWRIESIGLGTKKYPVCYCAHRAIDCVLELISQHNFSADDVQSVTVSLSDKYTAILRNHNPQTSLAAKFSIEFAMAAAIIDLRVGLAQVTDEFVQRNDVQSLMRRVGVQPTTDYDEESRGAAAFDNVSITLRSGAVLSGRPVQRARGHSKLPLTNAELFAKFQDCLSEGHYPDPPEPLFERLLSIETLSAQRLVRGSATETPAPAQRSRLVGA